MWNYRIIKDKYTYGLYEVFYNDDGEITAHADEAQVIGDKPEEILESIMLMQKDAQKSLSNILEMDKIKFASMYDEKDLGEAMTLEEFKKTLDKDK